MALYSRNNSCNKFHNRILSFDDTGIGLGEMQLFQLSHPASPRAITAILALGFAWYNDQNDLHSDSPRAIISITAFLPIRLQYIMSLQAGAIYYKCPNRKLKE